MTFKCPTCGYESKINDKCICLACGNSLKEMQALKDINNYLENLQGNNNFQINPSIIEIYYSKYYQLLNDTNKKKIKDLVENFDIEIIANLEEFVVEGKNKEIVNTLLRHNDYLELISKSTGRIFYSLLKSGYNYWDYDVYLKIITSYANYFAKKITGRPINVSFKNISRNSEENKRTIGLSCNENEIILDNSYVKQIYNQKYSILDLTFLIAHELTHCKITFDLLHQNKDENFNFTMECCIERACNFLASLYDYDMYKNYNYMYNYEENVANESGFKAVEFLITNFQNKINPEEIKKFKNSKLETNLRCLVSDKIIDFKEGTPKEINDFSLYESVPKDENIELQGKAFIGTRNIVYTHEFLDTILQENPQILSRPRYGLLNIIYVNDDGAVRRKNIQELQNEFQNTDNNYLKAFLQDQINYLQEKENRHQR